MKNYKKVCLVSLVIAVMLGFLFVLSLNNEILATTPSQTLPQNQDAEIVTPMSDDIESSVVEESTDSEKPSKIKVSNGDTIGTMTSNSGVNMDLIIYVGTDAEKHIENSAALMGNSLDNAIIIGHNWLDGKLLSPMARNFESGNIEDTVTLVIGDNVVEYNVTSVDIYPMDVNFDEIDSEGYDLSIVTCKNTTERYIFRLELA